MRNIGLSVQPEVMQFDMTPQLFDAIIIGTGQAGSPLASFLAAKKWKVAIIEKALIGGTCINYGCTPTKTMIAAARVAYLNKRAADFGIYHSDSSIDLNSIIRRKNQVVHDFRTGSEKRLESDNLITVFKGKASFDTSDRVKVVNEKNEVQLLTAKTIVINTGAHNHTPDLPGINVVPHLDSTSIMELNVLPKHLIILGGSYIALEFGQLFRRLGSKVTIIERHDHILQREDEDVAEEMKKILESEGITFQLNSQIKSVGKNNDQSVSVVFSTKDQDETISGTHIMLALGRTPAIDELRLENAGITTTEKGYIAVDDFLETNIKGIFALGDVNGGPAFTHIAYDDFRILSNNLIEPTKKSTKDRVVPYCVFTDPELGRTGITEKEAIHKKLNFKVAKLPMSHVARAIESGETAGFMKAIVDVDTDEILGACVLGVYGGEISSVLNLAILGKLKYTLLRDGIFAHPTFSESLNNLFSAFQEKIT